MIDKGGDYSGRGSNRGGLGRGGLGRGGLGREELFYSHDLDDLADCFHRLIFRVTIHEMENS